MRSTSGSSSWNSRSASAGLPASPVQTAIGVVRAEHPLNVGQQFPEQPQRFGRLSRLPDTEGEVVPGAQGVGVVRAEDAPPAAEQLCADGPTGNRGGDEGLVLDTASYLA